ncbi:unnamed protein product [Prunus armeniaca]
MENERRSSSDNFPKKSADSPIPGTKGAAEGSSRTGDKGLNRATNPKIILIVSKLTWLKRMRMTMRIMVLMRSMKELDKRKATN